MHDFLGDLLDRIEQTGANFSSRAYGIVGDEIVPLLTIMFIAYVGYYGLQLFMGTARVSVSEIIGRVEAMTAPLVEQESPADPVDALTTFAATLIRFVVAPNGASIMRLTIQSSTETPKLAHDVMMAGPTATIGRLAQFMSAEMNAGRMAKADPAEAAEMFAGMAAGHKHTVALLGYPVKMEEVEIQALARRIAERFWRAYAV